MRRKRPFVEAFEAVKITRDGDAAIIEYLEPGVMTTRYVLGPEMSTMSDQEIHRRFNQSLIATEELRASYQHVAVEIPRRQPQIEYFEPGDQWVPRGDVLRCIIDSGPDAETVIHIDDHELSLREFGRLLSTQAGWGMRIVFVPDDEIEKQPRVEVREPNKDDPSGFA